MFEAHFGLRENPFSTSHDPRFVYPSPEHLEAVAHFRYGLQNNEGFVLVTGEVGTGKTTAIMDLVSRLPQHAQVALIQNTALSRPELIEEICRRFGVEVGTGLSKPSLLARLEQTLRERAERGQVCLLVVDEAQNLSPEMLEEIRLLSNFELGGGSHFLICLVGQPELEERLARTELRQLRQRIGVKYHLQPLDRVECGRYLHHRLRVAGGDGDYLFPPATVDLLHGVTNGIPREINIVAGQAMLNAYVDGAPTVRTEHVLQVVEEFAFRSVLGEGSAEPEAVPHTPPAAEAAPKPRGAAPSAPPRVAAKPAATSPSGGTPSAGPSPRPTFPVAPRQAMPTTSAAPPVPPTPARSAVPPTHSQRGAEAVPQVTAAPAPTIPQPSPTARFVAERPAVEATGDDARRVPPAASESVEPASPLPDEWSAASTTPMLPIAPAESATRSASVDPRDARDSSATSRREPGRRIPAGVVATILLVLVTGLAVWTGAAENIWNGIFPAAIESSEADPPTGESAAAPEANAPEANAPEADARGEPSATASGRPASDPSASVPPPASAPAPTVRQGWSVQVASFQTPERARAALQLMEQRTGASGFVVSGVGEGGLWHAVRLGDYPTRAEAVSSAENWTEREWIPIDRFVVAPGS